MGEAEARKAVVDLRARGFIAVEGPPTAAHEVNWRNRTAPTWFGPDALVCLPWSSSNRQGVATVVEIDPAGGFGAGDHPSTRMMLGLLRKRGCHGTVLDVGCGSGVLSVAAVLLGATRVEAIDIAPASVASTMANATLNRVADRIHASATPLDAVTGEFDVVLANIHAPILTVMATDLRRLLAPRGWLGLSGISPAQASIVAAAMRPLSVVDRTDDTDGWTTLVLSSQP